MRNQNKAFVLISHRLSTVVNANKIVVLEQGKILEEGSHKELYEQKGAYFKLWQ